MEKKQNNFKHILLVCGTILVVLVAMFAFGSQNYRIKEQPIKIGFVGALTGFGAAWGEEQKRAVEMAVDEINNEGGVLGRQIQVIYEDGKCEGKTASIAAQKLISVDHVDLLVSICSSETLAVGKIADENKLVLLGMYPTNPHISGMSEYVFRNSYSDDDTGRIMAQAVNAKYQKAAIMTEIADYPVGVRDAFKKYFRGESYYENFHSNSTDLRTNVSKALSRSPEAIFINPNTQSSALALIRELELSGFKGALFMNYFGSLKEIQDYPYAKDLIFPGDPQVHDGALKKHLFEEFGKRYGKKPVFDFAVSVSYDSIYILKKAIEATGDTDSEKIKDYLHNLKDFKGVLGTYGFNEKGDATGYQPSLKQIQNG